MYAGSLVTAIDYQALVALGEASSIALALAAEFAAATMAVFTLCPVPYRILANRTRRVDFAAGLHSHY